MKAKNMTMSDAIPVILKMLKKGDFGNRKHRALELAVNALSKVSTDAALDKSGKTGPKPVKVGRIAVKLNA